ncbi:MAG: alpha/beta hydrolase [Gemmatimonadaceae bacterium]
MTVAVWLAAAAAWWVIRGAIARWREREFVRTHEFGPDGVIVGAEPVTLTGTRPGAILLLHGYNDSPQSLQFMAVALHAHGWTVRTPLLPGHGRRLQDWAATGAAEWERAARAELATLRQTHKDVAVGGLSMGGALAFMLAAEEPAVRAVIGFAPYLHASLSVELLQFLAPLASIGARYFASGGAASVHDPVASEAMIAYRRSTPHLAVELQKIVRVTRAGLHAVRQPVLVVQSREDNRIPAASAEEAFAMIGSTDKTLHWTTGNGHVVTVDYGHEAVEKLTAEWLESRLA